MSALLLLVWIFIGAYMIADFVANEHASGVRNIGEGDFTWFGYIAFTIIGCLVWPIVRVRPMWVHNFIHWLI